MNIQELQDEVNRLKEENGKLANGVKPKTLTFKINDKGHIAVHGLRAGFPPTMSIEQWKELFAVQKDILFFAINHKDELVAKKDNDEVKTKSTVTTEFLFENTLG